MGSWGALVDVGRSRGTRWVLAPFWGPKHSQMKFPIENTPPAQEGGVAAFKVEEVGGKLQATPAWVSRDMKRGEPVLIVNGMIFGYGSGEETKQAWPDIGLQFDSMIRAEKGTQGDDLCARRRDRPDVVVERRADSSLEPLLRHHGRQRQGVSRHLRRHAVLLWGGRLSRASSQE